MTNCKNLLVPTIFLIVLCQINITAQKFYLGTRLETLIYNTTTVKDDITEWTTVGLPVSLYIHGGYWFNRLGIESKAGVQIDSDFVGPELSLALIYKIHNKFFAHINYLIHFNQGQSHNTGGVYSTNFNFIGAGFQYQMTKLFGMDFTFYFPIGDKSFSYYLMGYEFLDGNNIGKQNHKNLDSMFKLSFIFNIFEF